MLTDRQEIILWLRKLASRGRAGNQSGWAKAAHAEDFAAALEQEEDLEGRRKFMSLREFMSLPDDMGRIDNQAQTGRYWISSYDTAKASFDAYGDSPPAGATVETVRGGFGYRGAGRQLKLVGVDPGDDNYFILEELHPSPGLSGYASSGDYKQRFVSYRPQWWKDFKVVG